jgi:hypothetical protein
MSFDANGFGGWQPPASLRSFTESGREALPNDAAWGRWLLSLGSEATTLRAGHLQYSGSRPVSKCERLTR